MRGSPALAASRPPLASAACLSPRPRASSPTSKRSSVCVFSRTTRAVVPTEAGGEFLARIEPILAALDEAEHSVREGGELRGLLRMKFARAREAPVGQKG